MTRQPYPARTAAQRRRDAMLARVTRTRWVTVAGAGGLSAALAALVGAVAPGRSSASTSREAVTSHATVTAAHARAPAMPPAADAAQLGLQPPGSAPQAPPTTPAAQPQTQTQSSAPAAPVSGGS